MADPRTLSIVIPCYNESATIEATLARVEAAALPQGWHREIVLVDDGSTDGTREILQRYAPRHRVLLRPHNGGKGAAVKDGLQASTGDYLLIQDADSEYDPSDYAALVGALSRAPVVFGSRLLRRNARYSAVYFYGSKMLTALFNMLFGTRLTDITTCYKLFPSTAVQALVASPYDDFVWDAIVLTQELAALGPIVEVPISYAPRDRAHGKKVTWRHGVGCIFAMLSLRLGASMQFVQFLIGGGTGLGINLLVLFALTHFAHVHYLISAAAAFLLAFAANFLIQRFWTFGHRGSDGLMRHAWQFFGLQVACNLLLNTAILYVLVEWLGLYYVVAQMLSSLGIAVLTYLSSKRYIFARRTI